MKNDTRGEVTHLFLLCSVLAGRMFFFRSCFRVLYLDLGCWPMPLPAQFLSGSGAGIHTHTHTHTHTHPPRVPLPNFGGGQNIALHAQPDARTSQSPIIYALFVPVSVLFLCSGIEEFKMYESSSSLNDPVRLMGCKIQEITE